MPEKSKSPPRNTAPRRAVLGALAQAEGWSYGLEIAEQTGLSSQTVYSVLKYCRDSDLVESSWLHEPMHGRPRRLYRITDAGRERHAEVTACPS
jgi:DNA-binding PadR family transcriptional regulator